jgi:carbamate kinase
MINEDEYKKIAEAMSGNWQQDMKMSYQDYLRQQEFYFGSMEHNLNYKSSVEYVKQHEEKKLIAQLEYDAMPLWKKILHKFWKKILHKLRS